MPAGLNDLQTKVQAAKEQTALVQINPPINDLDTAEVILNAKISTVCAECMTMRVQDETSAVTANDALARVRAFLRGIEEQRKEHHVQGRRERSGTGRRDQKTHVRLRRPYLCRRQRYSAAA